MYRLLFALLSYLAAPAVLSQDLGAISVEKLVQKYPVFSPKRIQQPHFNMQQLEALKGVKQKVSVKIFLGTWCHDSQDQVPYLIDLMTAVDNPNIKLELFTIGIKKKQPETLVSEFNVKFTPTVVVEINNAEVGRFIERPNQDWASDLVALLTTAK